MPPVAGLGWSLVVSETNGSRPLELPTAPDGSLGAPSVFADLGAHRHPDGLCVDTEGGVWVG
jgi:sugar lactone lactonase YvrE